MDGGHVIPDAIRDLLEQRAMFQEWLARLGELGGDFRPEVAEKVRADYAGRLSAVEGELAGHRAELETALADRSARVAEVAAEHDARSAELEETRLRHAVGEFDDREWERRRAGHQELIDELEARLGEQRSAVESLQTVLGELAGSAAAAVAVEMIEVEPPIPEEVAPEPAWDAPDTEEEADDGEPVEVLEVEGAGAGEVLEEEADLEDEEPWMTQPLDDVEEVEAQIEEIAIVEVDEAPDEADEEDVEGESAPVEEAVTPEDEAPIPEPGESTEFMDELEFLESLSLDDTESFDAVSAMLEEDEGESGSDEEETDRKTEGH